MSKGKQGTLVSPNYPQNYDSHDDCGWLIQVADNHVVRFSFEDFDVEPHANCSYDHVALYDGNSTAAPLLLMHCGQNVPEPNVITSTGILLFVLGNYNSSLA